MDPTELFPNWHLGVTSIGFLFGAGASKDAGYPLTKELTTSVLGRLGDTYTSLLASILDREHIQYDFGEGIPDIETISDVLQKYALGGDLGGVQALSDTIRGLIVEDINAVRAPTLDTHIRFFQALKRKIGPRAERVWLFTTNYDLVLESAAAEVGVPTYNGFEGIYKRYCSIDRLQLRYGSVSNQRFEERREMSVRLVKLHGSVSWYRANDIVFESFGDMSDDVGRAMILPRRTKVLDVLEQPFNQLFRLADRVLGVDCKYLVTCGYSFRDEHVNELLIPKCRENKLRVVALCSDVPPIANELRDSPSFGYVSSNERLIDGTRTVVESNIWRFGNLVSLLES